MPIDKILTGEEVPCIGARMEKPASFLTKGRLMPTVVFFAWEFEFGLFNY